MTEPVAAPIQPKLALKASALRLCLPYISTDPSRFYLGGVQIERHPVEGLLAVATDGTKLGAAWEDNGVATALPEKGCLVSLGKVSKALVPQRKDAWPRWLVVDGRQLRVVLAPQAQDALKLPVSAPEVLAVANDQLIEGMFPEWRRVIPSQDQFDPADACAPVTTTAHHLCAMLEGAQQVAQSVRRAARPYALSLQVTTSRKGTGPSLVRFALPPELPNFFAVVMPLYPKAAEVLGVRPEWIDLVAGYTAAITSGKPAGPAEPTVSTIALPVRPPVRPPVRQRTRPVAVAGLGRRQA